MDRLPLATELELAIMDKGQKYARYLYDLTTVYSSEITQLEAVTNGEWYVDQTGGMCCVLSWSVEDNDGRVLSCCNEGNLDIERTANEVWYLGYDQEDERGEFGLSSGETTTYSSFAEVIARLQKFVSDSLPTMDADGRCVKCKDYARDCICN